MKPNYERNGSRAAKARSIIIIPLLFVCLLARFRCCWCNFSRFSSSAIQRPLSQRNTNGIHLFAQYHKNKQCNQFANVANKIFIFNAFKVLTPYYVTLKFRLVFLSSSSLELLLEAFLFSNK